MYVYRLLKQKTGGLAVSHVKVCKLRVELVYFEGLAWLWRLVTVVGLGVRGCPSCFSPIESIKVEKLTRTPAKIFETCRFAASVLARLDECARKIGVNLGNSIALCNPKKTFTNGFPFCA